MSATPSESVDDVLAEMRAHDTGTSFGGVSGETCRKLAERIAKARAAELERFRDAVVFYKNFYHYGIPDKAYWPNARSEAERLLALIDSAQGEG